MTTKKTFTMRDAKLRYKRRKVDDEGLPLRLWIRKYYHTFDKLPMSPKIEKVITGND